MSDEEGSEKADQSPDETETALRSSNRARGRSEGEAHLCHVCRQTNFLRYARVRKPSPILLGTLIEVSGRREECALCDVVCHCLQRLSSLGRNVEDCCILHFKAHNTIGPTLEVMYGNKKRGELYVWLPGYDSQPLVARSDFRPPRRQVRNPPDRWSVRGNPPESLEEACRQAQGNFSAPLDQSHADRVAMLLDGVEPPYQHPSLPDFAAPIDWNAIPTGIDFPNVFRWLHSCMVSHSGSGCGPPTACTKSLGIILIDVCRKCLVELESSSRYLALSYVQGNAETFPTTRANLEERKRPGAFGQHGTPKSRVVEDAILFTHQLGEQYLWIDALCIVQDDAVRKHDQLMQMDMIYNAACLTIVSLSGRSANDGLPGLRSGSRPPLRYWCSTAARSVGSRKRYDSSVAFEARPSGLDDMADGLVYESRGWTFQERLLSRRCLFFTNNQLFFQCRTAKYAELDPLYAHKKSTVFGQLSDALSVPITGRLSKDIGKAPWQLQFSIYSNLVMAFARRDLSFPVKDRLNAFLGISATLQTAWNTSFTSGIPHCTLELGLLWFPASSVLQRQRAVEKDQIQPSWSWTGWIGPVKFTAEDLIRRSQLEIRRITIGTIVTDKRYSADWVVEETTPTPNLLQFFTRAADVCHFTIVDGHVFNDFQADPNTRIMDKQGRHCGVLPNFYTSITPLPSTRCEFIELSRIPARIGGSSIFFDDDSRIDAYDREFEGIRLSTCAVLHVMLVAWDERGEFAERLAIGQMHEAAWALAEPEMKHIRLL